VQPLTRRIVIALAALLLSACSGEVPAPQAQAASESGPPPARAPRPLGAPPNVILIVVDTLRADHLSHYGYARDTAGPIDDLRAESTIFSNAYSTAPWTGPSTMSIHTGLSTLRHGANRHGDALSEEAVTLAEHLSQAGYSTHGISFNHNVSEETGFDQGFDTFDDFLGKATQYPDIERMTRKVDRWLATAPPEPYFLYLQPMNVHGPYRVPRSSRSKLLGRAPSDAFQYYGQPMAPIMRQSELERREDVTPEIMESLVDQYDVAIHYSMEQIALMLEAIREQGLLDETVVILTSDHGEELFDHGGFSHGFTLHREVLNVPLYLRLPHGEGPATIDRPVSTLDIVPTVLELAGLPASEHGLDGHSLLSDPSALPADRVLVQHTAWAKRAEGLSLIRGSDHLIDLAQSYDTPDPRTSLYDLDFDRDEHHDLAVSEEGRVVSLRGRLEKRVAELSNGIGFEEPENVLAEMDVEMLRALGYVE
jgi:arylsulfatase A-like enzyme